MLTPAIQLVKCDFGAGLPSTPSTPIKIPAKMTARDEIGGTLRDPNSYLLIICPRCGRLFIRQRPPMTRPQREVPDCWSDACETPRSSRGDCWDRAKLTLCGSTRAIRQAVVKAIHPLCAVGNRSAEQQ